MIKFDCPKCKRTMQVPDKFAGKKGKCASCKTELTVPGVAATAVPKTSANGSSPHHANPQDLEALAASALADEPPPVEAEPTFVEFECPMCNEKLKLSADLAGKRAPCPECRRIIKVPELAKKEKKDWRKLNDGLPLGARRPDVPAPEGAWGSASASVVNKNALEEAGILPTFRPPMTVGQKIGRGVMIAGALVVVGLGYYFISSYFAMSREQRLYKTAQDYAAAPESATEVGREGIAALRALAGEYQLKTHRPESARDAKAQYDQAVALLRDPAGSNLWGKNEREALLADVALLQVDLGGGQDAIDKGEKLSWDDAQKGFRAALDAMQLPEARREAFRAVAQRLIERGQKNRVVGLASQIFPEPEKDKDKDQDKEKDNEKVAGLALAHLLVDAKPLPEETKPDVRLTALVALAETPKSDNADLEAAIKLVRTEDFKPFLSAAWSLPRLVELAARAGKSEDEIKPLLVDVKDVLLWRCQLALLRAKMASEKKVIDAGALDGIDAKSLERLLAQAALARHNLRLDNGWQANVDKWEKGAKAFGSIGAAQGLQVEK